MSPPVDVSIARRGSAAFIGALRISRWNRICTFILPLAPAGFESTDGARAMPVIMTAIMKRTGVCLLKVYSFRYGARCIWDRRGVRGVISKIIHLYGRKKQNSFIVRL